MSYFEKKASVRAIYVIHVCFSPHVASHIKSMFVPIRYRPATFNSTEHLISKFLNWTEACNPWRFAQRGIRNPGLWQSKYSERNLESHERLAFRIHIPRSLWVSMTKSGIQGVEPSPRFSFCRFFFPLCPYEHGAKRLPLLKPSYCITLSGECRCELKIPYFITCHLSDNLQSRPRSQRQTPLINAHSRTLKLYRDYSTHSKSFQM